MLLAAGALLLSACSDSGGEESGSAGGEGALGGGRGPTLTVMGGSELKDLEPILADVAQDTGVRLKMDYTGTLDGVSRLQSGETPDLVWFSHAKYRATRSAGAGTKHQ